MDNCRGYPIYIDNTTNRVSVNSGSIETCIGNCDKKVFVPLQDWSLTCDYNVDDLNSSDKDSDLAFISIIKLPDNVAGYLSIMPEALNISDTEQTICSIYKDDYYRHGCTLLTNWAEQHFSTEVKFLGHYHREPHLESVSIDTEGNYVGLHIDSFSNIPISKRKRVPSRICVNLGKESRFLTFANITISEMYMCLEILDIRPVTDCPNVLVKNFLRTFPNFPLNKIRIEPLEAYIAPTEIIIHDGSTVGRTSMDVSLTLLGKFSQRFLDKITV